MKTRLLLILTISSAIIILPGCAKKKGCTDSTAVNYDASAEKDDGSCELFEPADLYVGNYTSTDTSNVTNNGVSVQDVYTDSFSVSKVNATTIRFTGAFNDCTVDAIVTKTSAILTATTCVFNSTITFNSSTGVLRYTYDSGNSSPYVTYYKGTAVKQ